jgi:hypothetical protein
MATKISRAHAESLLQLRQTFNLYEVVYSIVFGAILSAIFPDALKSANVHSVPTQAMVIFTSLGLVTCLFGLSYNARLRIGIFDFEREALSIAAPVLTGAVLLGLLYFIDEWPLLTLLTFWALPYLVFIGFGPMFRQGGWLVQLTIKPVNSARKRNGRASKITRNT